MTKPPCGFPSHRFGSSSPHNFVRMWHVILRLSGNLFHCKYGWFGLGQTGFNYQLKLHVLVKKKKIFPQPRVSFYVCSPLYIVLLPYFRVFFLKNSWVVSKVSRCILFPFPHWFLKGTTQLPSWLVLKFLGWEQFRVCICFNLIGYFLAGLF